MSSSDITIGPTFRVPPKTGEGGPEEINFFDLKKVFGSKRKYRGKRKKIKSRLTRKKTTDRKLDRSDRVEAQKDENSRANG